MADMLIDPVASGIFGGDIKKLSVRACFRMLHDMEQESGSVVRAMLFGKRRYDPLLLDGTTKSDFVREHEKAVSVSFRYGMGSLVTSLVDAIEVWSFLYLCAIFCARCHLLGSGLTSSIQADPHSDLHLDANVTSINRGSDGVHRVAVQTSPFGQEDSFEASHVFSTIPANHLALLTQESAPTLAQLLRRIEFVSMGVVLMGFEKNVFSGGGFGYLVPSSEKEKILGVVYDSIAFPSQNNQTRKEETRLSIMCGGAHHPWICRISETELQEIAQDAVRRHLGITAAPGFARALLLRDCIPQYHVGFDDTVRQIEQEAARLLPQLRLGGNSFYGVGVADSVSQSRQLALDFSKSLK